MKYECPVCGYTSTKSGECPACYDATASIVAFEEHKIEPTPARLQVVDGDFFTCSGC